MSVIDLWKHRAPVTYTVTITHHWDDTLEVFVQDVADDARSRASVADALRRAADKFGEKPADPQQAREAALEKEVLRLKARLWAIGHAAGIETKEDLMRDACDAIGEARA